jgi:spermidine/putrescine transport system substrate-binding protein
MTRPNFRLLFSVLLMLSFLLSACATQKTEVPPPQVSVQPPSVTEAPVTNKVLRLLTWEGYAPDSLVSKFKQETGIDVQTTYVGDNNELIAKLAATKGSGFDLAQPTFNWVTRAQADNQIYQPLDLTKVKTEQIIPQMLKSVTEGTTVDGKPYSIPFNSGTTSLIVNTKMAPDAGKTYMDLCDPKYAGRISYRAKYDSFYMFGYAMGLDPRADVNDEAKYKDTMEKILAKMIECKKYVKTYWGSRQELEDLVSKGEVWLSTAWDATAWSLNQKNPDLKYVIPKEGAVGWIDGFAIPAGSENIDGAYQWINFIMRPENAAQIINETGYTMASVGSLDLSSPEMAKLYNESFPPAQLENIKWYFPLPAYAADIEADVQERLKAAPSQ